MLTKLHRAAPIKNNADISCVLPSNVAILISKIIQQRSLVTVDQSSQVRLVGTVTMGTEVTVIAEHREYRDDIKGEKGYHWTHRVRNAVKWKFKRFGVAL